MRGEGGCPSPIAGGSPCPMSNVAASPSDPHLRYSNKLDISLSCHPPPRPILRLQFPISVYTGYPPAAHLPAPDIGRSAVQILGRSELGGVDIRSKQPGLEFPCLCLPRDFFRYRKTYTFAPNMKKVIPEDSHMAIGHFLSESSACCLMLAPAFISR